MCLRANIPQLSYRVIPKKKTLGTRAKFWVLREPGRPSRLVSGRDICEETEKPFFVPSGCGRSSDVAEVVFSADFWADLNKWPETACWVQY